MNPSDQFFAHVSMVRGRVVNEIARELWPAFDFNAAFARSRLLAARSLAVSGARYARAELATSCLGY